MATVSPVTAAVTRPRTGRAHGSRWLAVLRTPVGAAAGVGIVLVLLLAVFAPIIWSHTADTPHVEDLLQGPSAKHWAGTDNLGRDIFLRVLVASRLSVELALLATVIAVVVGLLLGTAGVVLGRRVGRLLASVINVAVAFPGTLLALFFAVIFGVGAKGAVLAIGFAGAPVFGRLSQTLVAAVADRDFVAAARIGGVGRVRILLRHVLPNIAEPLVVNATIGAGSALLSFASLSFLGIGVQPPSYDWGAQLGAGLGGIYEQPIAALAPGLAVVFAGLAFNLFGESVAKVIGLTTMVGMPTVGRSRGTTVDAPDLSAEPATDPDGGTQADGEDAVLDVADLVVSFPGQDEALRPVRGVTFRIRRGEAVGVVGESGSGKSLTALAIARLIEQPGRVDATRLQFHGTDLQTGSARSHRQLLGTSFAMVFQDPMTSFNPTRRIGHQLAEVSRQHSSMSRSAAMARAVDRLRAVRVPAADRRARQYPHEFSGGMRQRAMIGMGVMGSPTLIVADEPTTALDVTVQRQVLDLLAQIRATDDVALLLISHDVTVVGQTCDRVLVMYAGRIVEDLPAAELRTGARHPYTRALVAAVPDMRTSLDEPLAVIPGRAPDPSQLPQGCPFAPRCPLASEQCRHEDPPLSSDGAGRRVACWHAGEPLPADAFEDGVEASMIGAGEAGE